MKISRGFIALISSVIMSTILLGLALTAGTSGAFSRFNALNAEYKRISLALAESCANAALLKIAQNYNYTPGGGETISLGNDAQGRPMSCTIKSVTYPNGKSAVQNTAVITTQASYPLTNGAFSNISISSTVQNPAYAVPARASVIAQTHVVNNNGGTKGSGDFTLTVSGGNPSPASFPGTETGTLVYVDPGSYTIFGSSDGAYTKNVGSECAGTLSAGQTAVCVITYDDIATTASLSVTAQVKNDNGGTLVPSDFRVYVDGVPSNSGVPTIGLAPGVTHTATADVAPAGYTASVWGDACANDGTITLNAGDKKNCTIVYDDNAPPSPICVDTVMMLDRTGSMGGSDLTDEKNAANNLLSLYAALTPLPKSSIGVFGAVGSGEPYNANIRQILTTVYSTLTSAVNTGLANSDGYTNLASAISVSQGEFTAHGTPGKGHVLILLSDGGANRPSGSTPGDTGFKVPTVNTQNGGGDLWTNPLGAYGAGDTSDSVGHRHRYSNLGFTVPSSATISGIEVQTNAWSSGSGSNFSYSETFGSSNSETFPAGWSETGNANTNNTDITGVSNSSSPSEDRTRDGSSSNKFARIGDDEWICRSVNATGYQSLVLKYYWKGDSGAESSDDGIVEYKTGGNCSDNSGWTNGASYQLDSTSWSSQQTDNLTGVNNSTFLVRFRTSASSNNEHFRVDDVTITGVPLTCTLGVDLSWNGGVNWSSEDTQILSTTNTLYTMNGPWTGHTWVPGDFSDTNFRVRLHDTNPGATCHVDTLATRVSYTVTTGPYEAALSAADAAKDAGTQIFTIHFGDKGSGNSDINFLATIANGTTPNPGHNDGSANDLSDNVTSGNTAYISPSTNIKDTGGDGNGFETNVTNAYADGGGFASNVDGPGDRHRYGGYNFNLPPGATVTGIQARPDWWTDSTSGTNSVTLELSWDGGAHWTGAKTQSSESTNDSNNKIVGASNDTWGRAWTPTDFSSSNFLVRITSNSSTNTRDFYLDWLPIQVFYTGAVPENADDDNFYVSPTSADMQAIFQAIGEKVCPALTAPPPAPPPIHGTLYVITHVINDNGGTAVPSDFKITVNGVNPDPNTFPMDGIDFPGTPISLDPGAFLVSADPGSLLYGTSVSGCNATVIAGDVRTCTVTFDDLPPPPGSTGTPLPPSNIIIGSWQETP